MATQEAGWLLDQPQTLGDRLKILRLEFGLSADAAALAVGQMDGQSWRNYEQDKHVPKTDAMKRIVCRFEGDEIRQRALMGWLVLGGEKPARPTPPFPFSLTTGSDKARPKTTRKAPTRRNSVYNVGTRVVAAA